MSQWQKDFNGLLDEICLEHGIELDHYQRGQKVSHQDTLDYQEGKIQAAVQYAKDTLETVQLATQEERGRLQEAQEEVKRLAMENSTLGSQNESLRTNNRTLEQKAEAMEQRAAAAEDRLAKAETAFSRFMEKVAAWIKEHTGLQRKLRTDWNVSKPHKDKIEAGTEETYKRGEKAILGASESIEDLLKAEDEVEQGTRIFQALKRAVKEDQDPDELLADDDFEM